EDRGPNHLPPVARRPATKSANELACKVTLPAVSTSPSHSSGSDSSSLSQKKTCHRCLPATPRQIALQTFSQNDSRGRVANSNKFDDGPTLVGENTPREWPRRGAPATGPKPPLLGKREMVR